MSTTKAVQILRDHGVDAWSDGVTVYAVDEYSKDDQQFSQVVTIEATTRGVYLWLGY